MNGSSRLPTPDSAVSEVMDANPPTVGPTNDQERAAWRAVQHGEPGLAVVDADGRFQGLSRLRQGTSTIPLPCWSPRSIKAATRAQRARGGEDTA